MTPFETFLIKKGYYKFALNCKTKKYEPAKFHTISTIENLDYRYFHRSDKNVLHKIASGNPLKDFTPDERKREICFGLSEVDKPATLIYPRPKILIKRTRRIISDTHKGIFLYKDSTNMVESTDVVVIENEFRDDSMNVVLEKVSHDKIFEGMYNRNICFEIDLT